MKPLSLSIWMPIVLGSFCCGSSGCAGLKTRSALGGESVENTVAEGASTEVQYGAVDSQRWAPADRAKTGVIFAWAIQGSRRMISESGCRLRVRHRESGDTVLLKIDGKNPVSIQPLKPGTWDAKRLGCGLTRVWDLEGLFSDGFQVKDGALSVIGWFVFEFDDRTLKAVREGARADNIRLASQLTAGWSGTSPLISGFSSKPIPGRLEARDEIVRVKSNNGQISTEILQPLLTRFQSCAAQAMKADPLRAGLLKMEVSYRGGQFVGAKTALSEHALRDDFVQCLLQAHETFQVASGGDFVLETTY